MKTSGRALAGSLVLVGAATLLANAASYLLSVFAARWMSVPQYGALGAMLSLSIIGGTVALGAQAVGVRRVAAAGSDPGGERGAIAALGAVLTLAVVAVGVAVAWPLGWLLNVPVMAVLFTIGAVAASVPGFSALGVVQGGERHRHYGYAYTSIGVLRAAGGLIALAMAPDVTSASLGIFLGSIAGTVVAVSVARLPRPGLRVPAGVPKEFLATTSSLVALYALSNADVLLARIFLDPAASGEYALGSLVAKIAFFLPYAVITVFFPKMAAGSMRHAFTVAVGMSLGIGVVATASTALLSGPLVWVIGGEKYAEFGSLAWIFAMEGSIFAVVQVIVYAGFSSRARAMGVLTVGALICQIVVISAWLHGSVTQIVWTTTAIATALSVVGVTLELRRSRARGAAGSAAAASAAGPERAT